MRKLMVLSVLALVGMLAFLLLFLGQDAAAQDIIWLRQFGTSNHDYAFGVATDAAGNVYVVGYTDGSLPGQTSGGGHDAFVRRYDPAGNELWTRQFGTPGNDVAAAVALDGTGNVYAVGFLGGDFELAFVRKYDPAGNELWTRQFGTPGNDMALAVALDGTGNAYVAGGVGGALPGQTWSGGFDAFVRKYDPAGNELWTRQFGTGGNSGAAGVAVDGAGNGYVAGVLQFGALPGQTSAGGTDVWVRKYNPDGTEVWTRQFGSPGDEGGQGVSADGAGNAYVAGGVGVGGALPGQTSAGGEDAFVRKYDSAGTEVWTRQFGSPGYEGVQGVSADGAGNAYVAGWTAGTLPGQTSAGGYDAWVRKYDSAGNEVWTRQFGSPGDEGGPGGVSADGAGNAYVAGATAGTLPGQTSAGSYDAFVAKIGLTSAPAVGGIVELRDAGEAEASRADGAPDSFVQPYAALAAIAAAALAALTAGAWYARRRWLR